VNQNTFFATLFPTHPDVLPIIEALRKKYSLPEVDPDGEPISEIYLKDKIISLDVHDEVEKRVRDNLQIFPPAKN
jgi:hypothetical protein